MVARRLLCAADMRWIAPLLLLAVAAPAHGSPMGEADLGLVRPSRAALDEEKPPRHHEESAPPSAVDHARSQKNAGKALVGVGATFVAVGVAAGLANLTYTIGEVGSAVGEAVGSIFGPPSAAQQAQFDASQRELDHQIAVTRAVALAAGLTGAVLAGCGAAAWATGARNERRAYQLEFGITPNGAVAGVSVRF
jgi:hypothetical protein